MRISRVGIDRFGLWRDLDLRLNPHGLSVIYGPNETGKTTLLRFVRAMLYGVPHDEPFTEHRGGEFRG
ncbi:MAG: ATP-binding protein, partial [Planctomycetaceae bacterium]